MKWFFISAYGFLLLTGTFFIWFINFGPEQVYYPDPYCDTVMAKDFTPEKFATIKPGMDSIDVIGILGQPLYIYYDSINNKPIQVRYEYTTDGKLISEGKEGDYAWYGTSIVFNLKGKVDRVDGGWVYD